MGPHRLEAHERITSLSSTLCAVPPEAFREHKQAALEATAIWIPANLVEPTTRAVQHNVHRILLMDAENVQAEPGPEHQRSALPRTTRYEGGATDRGHAAGMSARVDFLREVRARRPPLCEPTLQCSPEDPEIPAKFRIALRLSGGPGRGVCWSCPPTPRGRGIALRWPGSGARLRRGGAGGRHAQHPSVPC